MGRPKPMGKKLGPSKGRDYNCGGKVKKPKKS